MRFAYVLACLALIAATTAAHESSQSKTDQKPIVAVASTSNDQTQQPKWSFAYSNDGEGAQEESDDEEKSGQPELPEPVDDEPIANQKRASNFAFAKRPSAFAFALDPSSSRNFAFAKRRTQQGFAFAKRESRRSNFAKRPATFAFAKRSNSFAFAK